MNIKTEIQETINLLRMAALTSDLLPDSSQFDFPVSISASTLGNHHATLHIKIPFNLNALRQYRRAMGRGWKLDTWTFTSHDNSACQHASFIRPSLSPDGKDYLNPVHVSLAMDTRVEKSTCNIKMVGIKEIPVWEVQC